MLITLSSHGPVQEWGLIELQGQLDRRMLEDGTLALEIGTLHHAHSTASLSLTIGYHALDGKILPLKKPLAVMEKCNERAEGCTAYKLIGVVRNKYLFKMRPKALISKPHRPF